MFRKFLEMAVEGGSSQNFRQKWDFSVSENGWGGWVRGDKLKTFSKNTIFQNLLYFNSDTTTPKVARC